MVTAMASVGMASSRRKPVISQVQVNSGMSHRRISLVRILRMVRMMFRAPRIEEMPMMWIAMITQSTDGGA